MSLNKTLNTFLTAAVLVMGGAVVLYQGIPVLVLMVLCCSDDKYAKDHELDEDSFDAATFKDVTENSGIALPSDARGLHYFYKAPIDPGFAAKFELTPQSKDEMLQRLSRIEQSTRHVTDTLGPRFPWWVPAHANVLLDRASLDSTYLHAVLTEEAGRTFLYLEWWVNN